MIANRPNTSTRTILTSSWRTGGSSANLATPRSVTRPIQRPATTPAARIKMAASNLGPNCSAMSLIVFCT
jgi:hypothetical protein